MIGPGCIVGKGRHQECLQDGACAPRGQVTIML